MERAYQDSAWVLKAYSVVLQTMEQEGHEIAWHPHLWRWSAPNGCWIQEMADKNWIETNLSQWHSSFMKAWGRAPRTIHRIEERVDTGEIVLQAYVLPRPGENERLLRCETIKAGTSLMNQALDQLAQGTMTCLPQEESSAGYYSTPSMQEYRELHRRLKNIRPP